MVLQKSNNNDQRHKRIRLSDSHTHQHKEDICDRLSHKGKEKAYGNSSCESKRQVSNSSETFLQDDESGDNTESEDDNEDIKRNTEDKKKEKVSEDEI